MVEREITLVYNAVIADSSHSHGMDPQQKLHLNVDNNIWILPSDI